MRRRPTLIAPLLALAALVAAVPAASANFFGGVVVDGPSADIQRVGDVQLARDGTGAVTFLKGGGVFVSRFTGGAFAPPEQLNAGLGEATDAVVGAGDNGRLGVVFVSGGTVYAVSRPAGAGFMAPQALGPGTAPSVDLSINGTGYTTFTQGSDVRIARVDRRTSVWEVLGAPVDVDPAREAGTGTMRSSVATSADGIGIVAWGERVGTQTRVFARKVFGGRLSTAPQDLTVETLDGRAGTDADLPAVAAQDDSSHAVVAFRQGTAGGLARTVARRQRGTAFDDAVPIDTGDESSTTPRVDLNGRGEGLFGSSGQGSRQPMAATLRVREFAAAQRVGGGAPTDPFATPVIGETHRGFVIWAQGGGIVRARSYDDAKPGPESTISDPALGTVDPTLGFDAASDRANGVVAAYVQGDGDQRRIVASVFDRPPSRFVGSTSQSFVGARTRLSWQPAFDLWGPVTYSVAVNGQPVGQTTDTRLAMPVGIPDGEHRWQVTATDPRGQSASSRTRRLRLDRTAPRLSVSVSREGGRARVRVFGRDTAARNAVGPRKASGLRRIRVDWGDRSRARTITGSRATLPHRYRRGTFTLRVSATDKAGNATVVRRRIRVR